MVGVSSSLSTQVMNESKKDSAGRSGTLLSVDFHQRKTGLRPSSPCPALVIRPSANGRNLLEWSLKPITYVDASLRPKLLRWDQSSIFAELRKRTYARAKSRTSYQ